MVSQVLAQRHAPVGVQTRQYLDSVEEVGIHVGLLLELRGIFGCPPVVQVAVLVVEASLVVEAVGHLVTDNHADGTVDDGFVGLHVKEGRLQDAGREAYFIGGRFIVGIDGLWIHSPSSGVHGLACTALDILRIQKAHTLDNVLQVRLAVVDMQGTHVSPLVGIAHFHDEGGELLLGRGFSGSTHPLLCVDALSEGHLQVADQLKHTFLGGGREILLDIQLAHCLAHQGVHLRRDALPQGIVLLTARHHALEEVEVDGLRGVVQVFGVLSDFRPLHVVAILVGSHGGHQLFYTSAEFRLPHHELLDAIRRHIHGVHLFLQLDMGIGGIKLSQRHLVVVGLGIAQFGLRAAHLSQFGLHVHDVRHLLRSLLLGESKVLEHLGDGLFVGLADVGGSGVEIVLFLPHPNAALLHPQYILRGVLLVGSKIGSEEYVEVLWYQLQLYLEQLLHRRGLLHLPDDAHQRLHTLLVAALAVHGQAIEVGQFLLRGSVGKTACLQIFEDGLDTLLVVR